MTEKPKVSVIICTRDRTQETLRCIASVVKQTSAPDETLVVDASETRELETLLAREFAHVAATIRYIRSSPGLTHQRNVGARESSGDIIFFLDDDTVLEQSFIAEILKVFASDNDKRIGGVMGDIVNISRNESSLLTLFKRLFLLPHFGNGGFLPSGLPTFVHGKATLEEIECLSGGLTAYRREVLNEFSWDENLPDYSYLEDDDFSYRISRKYQNIYTPFARLAHYPSASARTDKRLLWKSLVLNYRYISKKNMPQTIKHKAAFYLALLGFGLESVLAALWQRNMGPFLGFLDGIRATAPISVQTHNKESDP